MNYNISYYTGANLHNFLQYNQARGIKCVKRFHKKIIEYCICFYFE